MFKRQSWFARSQLIARLPLASAWMAQFVLSFAPGRHGAVFGQAFYLGGNAYDFSKDLSTIVYAHPGGHADLYLLSQK